MELVLYTILGPNTWSPSSSWFRCFTMCSLSLAWWAGVVVQTVACSQHRRTYSWVYFQIYFLGRISYNQFKLKKSDIPKLNDFWLRTALPLSNKCFFKVLGFLLVLWLLIVFHLIQLSHWFHWVLVQRSKSFCKTINFHWFKRIPQNRELAT